MRNILFLSVLLFSFFSCSPQSESVIGKYKGTIPCADCSGIKTGIVLTKDSTFMLTSEYMGKSDRIKMERGTFTVENNVVKLKGRKHGAFLYLFANGNLQQLDLKGNKINGKMSDMYILERQ
ncbi:copper resistance protein NlpE [Flammeovirga kamogawensis]|uniref:Copper resistance protein NlpE n=1 Tax=Flammeovirga kamogawensis TaxID=373891 RepID=A0ABX8H383_9BACT|nr:copper resistance protein NlpE [Flammeovirga kamogawensis]MBB6464062.1 putative lipoprotein NlpE involved in copper resistance [Flammeovirga kamogawensis]QWG09876.1 copper resistance protein NlpE [Flammeovirga kamogawensis]TRX65382.1 copper resistance protein NlpE [Flammeovirga kamogawensis]